MAPWQDISIPLGGGVDTKTDPKKVKPPGLVDLQNGVFTEAPGITKRNGYDLVGLEVEASSTTAAIDRLDALLTHKNGLLATTGENWYTRGTTGWVAASESACFAPNVSVTPVAQQPGEQTLGTSLTHNNVQVTAWVASSKVWYDVVNLTTGAAYYRNTAVSANNRTKPQLAVSGNSILLFTIETAALMCKPFYTGNVLGSPAEVTTDSASTVAVFDVTTDKDGVCCVAYNNGIDLHGQRVNHVGQNLISGSTFVAQLSAVGFNAVASIAISASPTASELWLAATVVVVPSGTSIWVAHTNLVFANILTKADITCTAPRSVAISADGDTSLGDTGSCATLFFDEYNAATYLYTVESTQLIISSGAISATAASDETRIRHSALASGAWSQNFVSTTDDTNSDKRAWRHYVNVVHSSVLQSTYFTVCASGTRLGTQNSAVVAKILPGTTTAIPADYFLPHVTPVNGSASQFQCVLGYRKRLQTSATANDDTRAEMFEHAGLQKVVWDFASSDRYISAEVGNTLYHTAGCLRQWDGRANTEQGFHLYPENVTFGANGTEGAMTASSDYNYRVYYEWTNAQGERQRSAYAKTYTQTMGASEDETNLVIPTLAHTDKPDVHILVYRTESNADVLGGAPFYRVSSPNPTATGANGYLANSMTADTVAFNDEMSDATLIDNEIDPATSLQVDNISPPACDILAEGNSRVWLAGFEDGNTIWYSKLRYPGEQLEFSDVNTLQIPDDGGPITGLSVMDHSLVIFKRDRIYGLTGEGPDNQGRGEFSQAQLVTVDVGCKNQRSIVQMPDGIMFQSDKGIYILERNFQVSYVGAPVEGYNSQTITAATLVNDTNQVRFLTSSGRTLVFDYLFKQWTTFTNHEGRDAVVAGQTYYYLRNNSEVYQENATRFSDVGAHYPLVMKTPWLSMTGPQNYQRIQKAMVLGDWHSTHTLECSVRYDFSDRVDTGTMTPANFIADDPYGDGTYDTSPSVYGGAGHDVYQFDFKLPRQKCQSLQLEFRDKVPGASGRAYEITDLTLKVQQKKGPNKVQSAQQVSATGNSRS